MNNDADDARRFRFLCDNPNWSFIEAMLGFVSESRGEFYRCLCEAIDCAAPDFFGRVILIPIPTATDAQGVGEAPKAVARLNVKPADHPIWPSMNFIGLTDAGRALPAGNYELYTHPTASTTAGLTEVEVSRLAGIEEMVNRFLSWKLPADFSPDCGISFKRSYNETSPFGPQNHEPTGTNLLSGIQARQMVEHIVGRTAKAPSDQQIIRLANDLPGVGDCISGNAAITFARGLEALRVRLDGGAAK